MSSVGFQCVNECVSKFSPRARQSQSATDFFFFWHDLQCMALCILVCYRQHTVNWNSQDEQSQSSNISWLMGYTSLTQFQVGVFCFVCHILALYVFCNWWNNQKLLNLIYWNIDFYIILHVSSCFHLTWAQYSGHHCCSMKQTISLPCNCWVLKFIIDLEIVVWQSYIKSRFFFTSFQ